MYKEDLALSNPQELICHKTKPNQTTNIYSYRHARTYTDMHYGMCSQWQVL